MDVSLDTQFQSRIVSAERWNDLIEKNYKYVNIWVDKKYFNYLVNYWWYCLKIGTNCLKNVIFYESQRLVTNSVEVGGCCVN